MNFKHKYMCREYILSALGWTFSFTLLVFIVITIRKELLQDFPRWLPRDYRENAIRPLYFWFLLTVPVDLGIRKLLQMGPNTESN